MEMKNLFNQFSGESFICNDFFKNTILKTFRNEVSGLEIVPQGRQRIYIKTIDDHDQKQEEDIPVSDEKAPEEPKKILKLTQQEWKDAIAVAAMFYKWNSDIIPFDLWKEDKDNIGYTINNTTVINRVLESIGFEERIDISSRDRKILNLSHSSEEVFNAVVKAASENAQTVNPLIGEYLSGGVKVKVAPSIPKEEAPAPAPLVKEEPKAEQTPLHWESAFAALAIFMVKETKEIPFSEWIPEVLLALEPAQRKESVKNANEVFAFLSLPLMVTESQTVKYLGEPEDSYATLIRSYMQLTGHLIPERVQKYLDGEIHKEKEEVAPVTSSKKEEKEETETIVLVSDDESIKRNVRKNFHQTSTISENVITFSVRKDDLMSLFKLMMDIELSNKSKILGALNSEGTLLKKVQEKVDEVTKAFG